MFFFRKKSEVIDLSWIEIDMHSHFIPGIDDGAPEVEASLTMIKGLADFGYKKVITTPHVLWDMYKNTTPIILKGLASLQEAVAKGDINIEVQAAAEYYIDEHFQQDLKAKLPLLTLKDNIVLVEFSMMMAPFDLKETLFELQMQGYQPVIAHPERYIYLNNRRSFYEDLKDTGCYFQLNILALTGFYGKAVHELAEYLAKNEFYDLIGTDMHTPAHLDAMQKLSSSATLRMLKEGGMIRNKELLS